MTNRGESGTRDDLIVHERSPFNAETPRAVLGERARTPADAFYVRNHGPVPSALDALRVTGDVARPLTLTLEQLRADFPARRVTATLQCAGNRRAGLGEVRPIPGEAPWGPGATGTAEWTGVPLAQVLARAGPTAEARHAEFIGADRSPEADPPERFGASIPLEKARGAEVLLAWEMNGEPLPALHGGPLRVVVPGYIGARSVKWLEQIILRAEPSANFFQARTYRLLPPDAPPDAGLRGEGVALQEFAVNADFLVPEDGSRVSAGATEVLGYALGTGGIPVERVEVSADGGRRWERAQLLEDAGPWAWRRWRAVLALEPGRVELVARAWDISGATQPEDPASLWNPKGYANNSWARLALEVG